MQQKYPTSVIIQYSRVIMDKIGKILSKNVCTNGQGKTGKDEELYNIESVDSSLTTRYDDSLEDILMRQTYTSTERHIKMSAEVLADKFGIGLERARQTLRATTQRGTRSALLPISSRRYCADRQFGVKRLKGKFSTDTIWAKSKTLRGNVASQIYSHKCGFNTAYHLESANGENVGYSLSDFVSDYGAPESLTFDGAAVQVGRNTHFQDTIRKNEIKSNQSGAYRPNENPAKGNIQKIKKKWYRIQATTNSPD